MSSQTSRPYTYSRQRVIVGGRGRRGGKQRDHPMYLNDKNVILRVIYALTVIGYDCPYLIKNWVNDPTKWPLQSSQPPVQNEQSN